MRKIIPADCVVKAISEIRTKIAGHYQKEYFLSRVKELKVALSPRQEKFLKKFLLWPTREIFISKYMEIFGVTHQTARSDLLDLAGKRLLTRARQGKKFIFSLNYDF